MKNQQPEQLGLEVRYGAKAVYSFSYFFTVRTIIHWNNIPRNVVDFPSLEVFKMQLETVLDNLI